MDQAFTWWLNVVKDYGFPFAIAILAIWGAWEVAVIKIRKLKLELEEKMCKGADCPYRVDESLDLSKHPLWEFITSALITKIPTLPIKEEGRLRISQRFMAMKFEAVRDCLRHLLKLDELDELSTSEFTAMVFEALNNAIVRYESRAEEAKIPPVFLTRFRKIHAPAIESLFYQTELVCASEWNGSNSQKLAIIFDDVRVVLRRTLLDCEYTLGTINGELDGAWFDGIQVRPIPGHKTRPYPSEPNART